MNKGIPVCTGPDLGLHRQIADRIPRSRISSGVVDRTFTPPFAIWWLRCCRRKAPVSRIPRLRSDPRALPQDIAGDHAPGKCSNHRRLEPKRKIVIFSGLSRVSTASFAQAIAIPGALESSADDRKVFNGLLCVQTGNSYTALAQERGTPAAPRAVSESPVRSDLLGEAIEAIFALQARQGVPP
jgi:hypothetical protein